MRKEREYTESIFVINQMQGYTTIKNRSYFEYEDRKSVFIGEAMPVSTEREALDFIESIKKKYSDARHHVYAYVLRENFTTRFSDDREPQGTAGMPVLDVIRKNGCTDTVIVVTRYFGGTLLGTGGLVKAYTSAALGALNGAEIIRYDIYNSFEVTLSYSDYGKIGSAITEFEVRVDDTLYDVGVKVVGTILKSRADDFSKQIVEITSGRSEVKITDEKFAY